MRAVPDPIRSSGTRLRPESSTINATLTTLTLSESTVDAGVAVTLTAHVSSGATAVTPGILLFCNAALPTCSGPEIFATAVLNTQGSAARTLLLPVGNYSIKSPRRKA